MTPKPEDVARGVEISKRLASLESLLREHDAAEWASRLDRAEAGGSTGTEILHRVGVVLRELRKSGEAKRLGVEQQVMDLAGLVDRQMRI